MVHSPTLPAHIHTIAHTNARARTHTHTDARKTQEYCHFCFCFTFFLGGMVVKALHSCYPTVVTTRSNYRSPGSSKWDMRHWRACHGSSPQVGISEDAVRRGGKKTKTKNQTKQKTKKPADLCAPFLCAKVRYFPRNRRRAESTAGDADERREGFLLRVYCEWSVVTLSRVLGGIKGLFLGAASVEPHTAQSDLKHRTNQEGVRSVQACAITQSEGCLI